jgi:hypothetical protein
MLFALGIAPAQAQTTSSASSSVLGPVKIDGFTVTNGQLFGFGRVTLPGGSIVPFSAPATISAATAATSARSAPTACTILSLVLGPVDLNLLGLVAHLDQLNLLVTAEPGPGNLLGNLLCSSKKNNKTFLTDVATSLTSAFSNGDMTVSSLPVNAATGTVVSTIDYQQLSTELVESGVTPGSSACPILHLEIQDVNVLLLGLRIQSLAPIVLDVTAIPGDGNLLGNLFCQLAHLLDGIAPTNTALATSTVTSILSTLTGGVIATLPSTGTISTQAQTVFGVPITLTTKSASAAATTTTICTVLHLILGPVDLNLLGLIVHLDQVNLLVTAEPGPNNLVGNLLCPDSMNKKSALADVRNGLAGLVSTPTHATAVGVSSSSVVPMTSTATSIAPGSCPILHLEIQQLNLFLLGLRIQTLAPIVLDVSAQSGPGNLLGNLLCYVGGLLDPVATLTPDPRLTGGAACSA